jgi:hypothetical protein
VFGPRLGYFVFHDNKIVCFARYLAALRRVDVASFVFEAARIGKTELFQFIIVMMRRDKSPSWRR